MNRVTRVLMALMVSSAVPLLPGVASAGCVTPATKIIFAPQSCEAALPVETPTSPAVAQEEERKGEKADTQEKAPAQREAAPAPRMSTARVSGRTR